MTARPAARIEPSALQADVVSSSLPVGLKPHHVTLNIQPVLSPVRLRMQSRGEDQCTAGKQATGTQPDTEIYTHRTGGQCIYTGPIVAARVRAREKADV